MVFVTSRKISALVGFLALLLVSWSIDAWCGPLKLVMRDGTSVEVQYYWITGGEYRFDIPGGVAGVPSSQVASVQEILEAKEFDPDVLIQSASESSTADQRQLVQSLVESKHPGIKCEQGDQEEGLKRFKASPVVEIAADKPKIYSQKYTIEKSLPFVCDEPGGPVLVIQELMSSATDMRGRDFNLILYDSEGRVLSRKACEVYPLTLDQEAQRKLQVKSKVYLVRASVKPDPKIKRYEIAAVQK